MVAILVHKINHSSVSFIIIPSRHVPQHPFVCVGCVSTALYPTCDTHSDCLEGFEFCSVKCRTGGCVPVPAARESSFCQPCEECRSSDDSVGHGCDLCEIPLDGSNGIFLES